MGFFAFILGTKLGRALGLAALIAAIGAGLYLYGRHNGKVAGHTDGAKQQLDEDRRSMESDRAAFQLKINSLGAESEAKDAVIAKQGQLISVYDAKLAELEKQSTIQQAAISRMSDSEVTLDLARRLQVRSATDATPSLYPGEVRKADSIVADHEVQSERLDAISQKVEAQDKEIGALKDKQAISDKKFSLAIAYINESDARFAHAYNVFYRLHHPPLILKIITLGIVRDKKIPDIHPIEPPVVPAGLK